MGWYSGNRGAFIVLNGKRYTGIQIAELLCGYELRVEQLETEVKRLKAAMGNVVDLENGVIVSKTNGSGV